MISKIGCPVIAFHIEDIQTLSEKYFGDKLTEKETKCFRNVCLPNNYEDKLEESLNHILQAVISIIGLVRQERRGNKK